MNGIDEYIRTAILIDDRVDEKLVPQEERVRGTRRPTVEPGPGLVEPPPDDETPVHWRNVVSSFLEADVVCSVIEPVDRESVVELAVSSAEIADLLVLDWLFYGDDERAVEAIVRIAKQFHNRVKVIAVFTGDPRLTRVVDRLTTIAGFESHTDFILKRGSTVVLIYSKPTLTKLGVGKSRRVEYEDLPAKIRADLASVYKGLMPSFVFEGINVLRKSVPRILATFGAELDAAALTHRALLREPSDAGHHFIRLLASELEQALIANGLAQMWSLPDVREALSDGQMIVEPGALRAKLDSCQTRSTDLDDLGGAELVREAIARGLFKVGLSDGQVTKATKALQQAFGMEGEENSALAVLMTTSDIAEMRPRLELGVIVRDAQGRFLLCIQPLCDSVQLSGKRRFPMMPLRKTDSKPVAMIMVDRDKYIPVQIDPKAYKLELPLFEARQGSVVASGEAPNWFFECVEKNRYEVVSRLRIDVALQATHRFVSDMSRVGVNRSEWLWRARHG